ncbi:MAG: PAS domain S-box protein [Methylococcaceae bacterium]|nr:PAS domain S-box protein [Methylococcaceae bacterium]
MNAQLPHKPTTLLLVDDDQVDRLAIRRAFAQCPDHDFELLEAETGSEGLQLARSRKPDCILLDYNLPDFSGVEFLSELAEDSGELQIPVVMLTGTDNALIAVDAIKRGARDYLVKITDQQSLQWLPAVILRALREQQALRDKAEAVDRLREAEAKFRTLVEQIPAITYLASMEEPGKLRYVSPQIHSLGYTPEEWLGNPEGLLQWVHKEDRERVIDAFAQLHESHGSLRCEYRLLNRQGTPRWFLDQANVVRDESGRPLFLQGILLDITEEKELEQELEYYRRRLEELVAQRTQQLEKQSDALRFANANMDRELCRSKRMELELRASEARFRLLLESVGEGIYGIDADGNCSFVNRAALDMLGYANAEELLGCDIHARIHHSRADGSAYDRRECPLYDVFEEGIPAQAQELVWRKDSSSFMAECSSYPVVSDGRVSGVVVVFRDAVAASPEGRDRAVRDASAARSQSQRDRPSHPQS